MKPYHYNKVKLPVLMTPRAIRTRGYKGNGNREFEKATKPLVGLTCEFYLLLKERRNFKDLFNKYAAMVPHVLLISNRLGLSQDRPREQRHDSRD